MAKKNAILHISSDRNSFPGSYTMPADGFAMPGCIRLTSAEAEAADLSVSIADFVENLPGNFSADSLLPVGLRMVSADRSVGVFERPPTKVALRYREAKLSSQYENVDPGPFTYEVNLPWTVYVYMPGARIASMFFRPGPLISEMDQLYPAWLPNVGVARRENQAKLVAGPNSHLSEGIPTSTHLDAQDYVDLLLGLPSSAACITEIAGGSSVCLGDWPDSNTLEGFQDWLDIFWSSTFNDDLTMPCYVPMIGGNSAIWEELGDKHGFDVVFDDSKTHAIFLFEGTDSIPGVGSYRQRYPKPVEIGGRSTLASVQGIGIWKTYFEQWSSMSAREVLSDEALFLGPVGSIEEIVTDAAERFSQQSLVPNGAQLYARLAKIMRGLPRKATPEEFLVEMEKRGKNRNPAPTYYGTMTNNVEWTITVAPNENTTVLEFPAEMSTDPLAPLDAAEVDGSTFMSPEAIEEFLGSTVVVHVEWLTDLLIAQAGAWTPDGEV